MIHCTNCKKPVRESHWTDDAPLGWTQHWVHDETGVESCYPRNHMADAEAVPNTDTLEGWLAVYAATAPGEESRVLLDLDMDKVDFNKSPLIILRYQGRVMILNPMALKDHLCVDAHAFVDGEDARTGVFGMEDGRRTTLEYSDDGAFPAGTSHKWPATKLVTLLLGDQTDSEGSRT